MTKGTCDVCGKEFSIGELISGHGIMHEIERLIQADFPYWNDSSHICADDFDVYRVKYISGMIEEETGSIRELESEIIKSINDNEFISENTNVSYGEKITVGERIADKVALFGGSWYFITTFFFILAIWIAGNTSAFIARPFDPYPYILLNLILSCLAAIQAPIIMMSQNRQESKDRVRSENDYKINLKSEIEIRTLHEKVDHLLLDQWSKMMKIQELQLDILADIRQNIRK